ncbi:HNH endonuclease [Pantoea agglomerans]|uniref:HNH endonuclease n=1 Tax=Enterobacter agglomerans TaxID=549 RepID=UPI003208AA4F
MLINNRIDSGFETILPIPTYPDKITKEILKGKKWDNTKGNIPKFKTHLKEQLRTTQDGRCAYCRRFLGLVSDTHLEHIIEKALYTDFTYEIVNISLSCSECNHAKNQHSSTLKRKLKQKKYVPPFLFRPIPPGTSYPVAPQAYRFVHPYFDKYSDHITISKGWIYKHHSVKGAKQIRFLKFNAIGKIEKQFRIERLRGRKGTGSKLIYLMSECAYEKLPDLISQFSESLRKGK